MNGAITERTGSVTYKDFRIADNGVAGIEVAEVEDVLEGYTFVDGAMIIGNTGLNDADGKIGNAKVHGFIGPKTEFFEIKNTKFYNYDNTGSGSGALGTCSHCFHSASSDSGGRTYKTSNLSFENTSNRIYWQEPHREIINDLDGSLTGLGANSWAVPF